ncbi:MAG: hypothetical protein KF703_14635 [Actinobacteria bacterium]|nr:hypothetical protein [Actinomycetota bacterium]
MKLSHQPDHRRLLTTERARREGGYVMATFGLLLVPLLLMVGFSVDVGGWYNKSQDIQRAADAAALAGVVWLPDLPKAETYAREAAKRNGYENGTNGVIVTVEQVADRRLRVTITDPSVGSAFYSKLGGRNISIKRRATAEYVLPVPLGSPRNFFGTGTLDSGYDENLWLSINTWCTDKVDGDRYQSRYSGNRNYSNSSCPSASQAPTSNKRNDEYRENGYEFYIEVPENRTGNIDVLVYDAKYQPSRRLPDLNLYSGSQTYYFAMFMADDTPVSDADNPPILTCAPKFLSGTAFTSGINFLGTTRWNKICTITTSMRAGRYVLRVKNNSDERSGAGANNFSLVAKYSSAPYTAAGALCDARTVSTCPKVYGKDAISVFASEPSSTADFYLAEISEVHTGKTMIIDLFDPGEGGNSIQIRRPTGANSWTNSSFTWESSDGTSGGPTTSLDVTNSRFNGETVQIAISLAGYNPPANNKWWQVRYQFGSGTVTDRTTWSARVVGDPVHLIEEDS